MAALSGMSSDKAGVLSSARGQSKEDVQHKAWGTLGGMLALLCVLYGTALFISWKPLHLNLHSQPKIATGFNAFALLFILALAIERVIQPISGFLGPDSSVSKAQLKQEVPDKSSNSDGSAKKSDAQKNATVSDDQSKTALVTWAAATGLACLAAVGLHITLLHAVLDPTSSLPPYWLDLAVTGLAVGAGTKPLNDLWTTLQSKS